MHQRIPVLGLGLGAALLCATPEVAAAQQSAGMIEEVVVTATRTETDIQSTPVQVTAFSGKKLQERAASQMNDLTYIAPSVRFTSTNNGGVAAVTMRGIDNPSIGTAGIAVQTYFLNAPRAVNSPTYDIANIQVLQGPQGTLFGRNTIGGAILVDPVLPGFNQDGYARVTLGNYQTRVLEGAANIPVVDEVLSFRVAGQIWRQDPIVKSLSPTLSGQYDRHDNSFRVSALFQPTPDINNVLVYDYFRSTTHVNPSVLFDPVRSAVTPSSTLFGQFPSGLTPASVAALVACDHRCIQYGAADNSLIFNLRDFRGLFDQLTWQLSDNLTFRNYFGYQKSVINVGQNALANPLRFFLSQAYDTRTTLSEDAQIVAEAWDSRFRGIFGFYYEKNETKGTNGSALAGLGLPANTSGFTGNTKAVYGNVTFQASQRLQFNAGYRETWRRSTECAVTILGGSIPRTSEACFAAPNARFVDTKNSDPSYTIGLNYQATDDLYFYAVTRHAVRPGGTNPSLASPCYNGGPADFHAVRPAGTCADLGVTTAFTSAQLQARNASGAFIVTDAMRQAVATGRAINLSEFTVLRPQKLNDVELGMRSDWNLGGWRQRFNLTYFHYNYTNVLQNTQLGAPAPAQYDVLTAGVAGPTFGALAMNAGDVKADGVQAQLVLNPVPQLTIDANVSYIKQRVSSRLIPDAFAKAGLSQAQLANVTSSILPQITSPTAPWSVAMSLRYVLPFHPLDGELVFNYNYFWSDGWTHQNFKFKGYDLHNVRLDWRDIGDTKVSAAVFVRNAADELYVTGCGNCFAGHGYYGEPRMYGAELTWRFN